jgi:hypothetical protein
MLSSIEERMLQTIGAFLYLKTTTADLFFGDSIMISGIERTFKEDVVIQSSLIDRSGDVVGKVIVMSDSHSKFLGTRLQCIKICNGFGYSGPTIAEKYRSRGLPQDQVPVCHVLLVEKLDNVKQRFALAVVVNKAWNMLSKGPSWTLLA